MKIIKAKFRIVTPMFLGEASIPGSGQNNEIQCAESIRGASVKGALRAMYRSLNWGRIRNQSCNNDEALNTLHKAEADLFGASAKTEGDKVVGGQAKFLLRVKSDKLTTKKDLSGKTSEIEYLLGMGLFHFRAGMLRDHIEAGSDFTIELGLKPVVTEQQQQQLADTLLLFGLLGNLGSRARKGFGSVSIVELSVNSKDITLPQNADEYKAVLENVIGKDVSPELPPFTAFSSNTQLQISDQSRNPMELLKKHGLEFGMYRGYGREVSGQREVFGRNAEANFVDDHDWAYQISQNNAGARRRLPRRAVFGLPHPYFLGSGAKIAIDAATGRRASPLFAHIHQLPNGESLLVHTLYQADFLPNGVGVDISVGKDESTIFDPSEQFDWGVIENFLERFENRDVIDV